MTTSIRTAEFQFLNRARRLVREFSPFLEFINERQFLAAILLGGNESEGGEEQAAGILEILERDELSEVAELIVSAFQSLNSGGALAANFYSNYRLLIQAGVGELDSDLTSSQQLSLQEAGIAVLDAADSSENEASNLPGLLAEAIDAYRSRSEAVANRADDSSAGDLSYQLSIEQFSALNSTFALYAPSEEGAQLNFLKQPEQPPRLEVFEDESFIDFEDPQVIAAIRAATAEGPIDPPDIRPEDEAIGTRTRRTTRRAPEVDEGNLPPFKFNVKLIDPNPEDPEIGPNLVSLLVNDVSLMPANRDTGIAELFMNFIPTYEMSRAVPYLDIGLIIPGAQGSDRVVSLASALNGGIPDGLDPDTNPADLLYGADRDDVQEIDLTSSTGLATGIELFTAPQTLVTNQGFVEPDDLAAQGSGRVATPLDRFAPLASFNGISFDIAASHGLIAYKQAKMSITVHDRGRLHELGAFIRPELYSRVHMYVEYGWSHPDNDIEKNPFGYLINTLRSTEKFTIRNSKFNMDASGKVSIDVDLTTRGSERLALSDISKGEGVEAVTEKIDDVIRTIQDALAAFRQNQGGGAQAATQVSEIFAENVLGAVSTTDASVSTVDDELSRNIQETIRRLQDAGDSNLQDVRAGLVQLYGDGGTNDGADPPLTRQLQATIAASLERKRRVLYNGLDPFLPVSNFRQVDRRGTLSDLSLSSTDEYVSLAKLLMNYVGKPLAATKRFDEVQFLFYPFNTDSGNLRNKSVASFPIKRSEFLKLMQDESRLSANMPLERFLSLLDRTFVSDQANEAYGLSSLYQPADENGNRELIEALQDDATEVVNLKQQLLRDIYGSSDAEARFRMPSIKFHVEAVPRRTYTVTGQDVTGEGLRVNFDDAEPSVSTPNAKASTILRIHVMDEAATPHASAGDVYRSVREGQFNAIRQRLDPEDDAMGHQRNAEQALNLAEDFGILESSPAVSANPGEELQLPRTFRVRGGIGGIKRYLRRLVPTIRFGTPGSAATNATFSSNSDSALATINILRAGRQGDAPPGLKDAGLPLSIFPTEVELETIGFPFYTIGQQFFVDFDTGTTADNIYGVASVGHTIEPGKFKSQVKLVRTTDAYGEYRALVDQISNALNEIGDTGQGEE